MIKKLFFTFSLLFFSGIATAQVTIKGQVLDANQIPVEDAYIYNTSTLHHTHSDAKGFFSLKNNTLGDTIQIGLLGYQNHQLLVTSNSAENLIKIPLKTQRITLDELVLKSEDDILSSILLVDLRANPVNSSQELLRRVPGLFIGQHAGGGKAEQIFLRGFDVDHGTDVRIEVDGMPVNMVSHAHGQGYSDLHFLIPETIQKIDFGKGPYHADKGDFNTAGYVDFTTKESLDTNYALFELGDFNSQRLLTLLNVFKKENKTNAYLAVEHVRTDGAFESPQNFRRTNLFSKYTTRFKNYDKLSILGSYFTSEWTASGQIPQRAVDNGSITRFGAIDDTEGGNTSRLNLSAQHITSLGENQSLQTQAFYSYYDFELYSNFTFFLEDPINGDQIRQKENRSVLGLHSVWKNKKNRTESNIEYKIGAGFRRDQVNDNELSRTKNRTELLERIQFGDIQQWNAHSFFDVEVDFGKWEINAAARLDYFHFKYQDQLQNNVELSGDEWIVNPKFNLSYQANTELQLFLKSGIGFHSNDTRLVLQQNRNTFLPRAYGVDLGTVWKPSKKLLINTALWYLLSEEELVYVGDAGIVEPSGRSRRYGVDFGFRYQITDWLYLDSDVNWAYARSLEETPGNDFIPLAPDYTYTGGISVMNFHGFSGGFQMRYLDTRPANEDNSISARGYFITDVTMQYQWKQLELGIVIENLFDAAWNETQFETTSRLQNELTPTTEIHFTPGVPFYGRIRLAYHF
jgi:outer membrane cobalamin receptor